MGAQGTTTLDFGAFPGGSDASVAVTGQAAIVSGSVVEAWMRPVATADHTADEHMVETINIYAGNIVGGTGFTVYGFNTSQLGEEVPPAMQQIGPGASLSDTAPREGGKGTRIYGQWTIAWVWN